MILHGWITNNGYQVESSPRDHIFRILGDKKVQKWLLHDCQGKEKGRLEVKRIIDQ